MNLCDSCAFRGIATTCHKCDGGDLWTARKLDVPDETGAESPDRANGAEIGSPEAVGVNRAAPETLPEDDDVERKLVGRYTFSIRDRYEHGRRVASIIRSGRIVGVVKELGSSRYRSLAWDRTTGSYTRLPKTKASFDAAVLKIVFFDETPWR